MAPLTDTYGAVYCMMHDSCSVLAVNDQLRYNTGFIESITDGVVCVNNGFKCIVAPSMTWEILSNSYRGDGEEKKLVLFILRWLVHKGRTQHSDVGPRSAACERDCMQPHGPQYCSIDI